MAPGKSPPGRKNTSRSGQLQPAPDARAYLDGDVDQTRGAKTTYGEAFNYAEPYTELGNTLYQFESLARESGYHFARLRHERYLNQRTCPAYQQLLEPAPGQVLETSELAPHRLQEPRGDHLPAHPSPPAQQRVYRPLRRDALRRSIVSDHRFRATEDRRHHPRPHQQQRRPRHLRGNGPPRLLLVNSFFDRDTWPQGRESRWLRLARPYAGDTYGLHLPLIDGTEVAIAFEEGDPDRPYIAHALHDSERPDLVTDRRRDHTRTSSVYAGQQQAAHGRQPRAGARQAQHGIPNTLKRKRRIFDETGEVGIAFSNCRLIT